jgi:hypothetical protein
MQLVSSGWHNVPVVENKSEPQSKQFNIQRGDIQRKDKNQILNASVL